MGTRRRRKRGGAEGDWGQSRDAHRQRSSDNAGGSMIVRGDNKSKSDIKLYLQTYFSTGSMESGALNMLTNH